MNGNSAWGLIINLIVHAKTDGGNLIYQIYSYEQHWKEEIIRANIYIYIYTELR